MPSAPENLVINTGPLIALGKIEAFDLVQQLPIRFSTPRQVAGEIETGARLGHPVTVPPWVAIHDLSGDVLPLGQHVLDVGALPNNSQLPRRCDRTLAGLPRELLSIRQLLGKVANRREQDRPEISRWTDRAGPRGSNHRWRAARYCNLSFSPSSRKMT